MPSARDPLEILDEGRSDSARRSALRAVKGDPEAERLVEGLFNRLAESKLLLRDYDNARNMDPRKIRTAIMGLAEAPSDPPEWIIKPSKSKNSPGVPTLFASDWHFGEKVNPTEINGVNKYDLSTAKRRAKSLVERACDLLQNHMVNPNYPGIVFALGGDMVSGDLHEELRETNEIPSMPTVLELRDVLVTCIRTLADNFGRVFVPCVAGNHGRTSHKPRHKFRAQTNFDWLLYTLLEREFNSDKRVQFQIPDGPDCNYSIYGHRFLLTHGDRFRGGDGMIGALGPIIRGDHKMRSRANQINMEYDTLMVGHWHQYCHLGRVIVNGSLKGYDEYAFNNGFGFEVPKQALFMTHPKHGITFAMPVVLEDKPNGSKEWITF